MTQHQKCWVSLLTDQLTDPFYHSFVLPIVLFTLLFLAYPMECLVGRRYPWAQDLDEVWSWQLDASSKCYGKQLGQLQQMKLSAEPSTRTATIG